MPISPEMQSAGITPKLLKTTKKIRCPRCNQEFSLFQSRAIACAGCPKATTNCELVRCLRCDLEFPMVGPLVPGELGQRNVSVYMNQILDKYLKSVGRKPGR